MKNCVLVFLLGIFFVSCTEKSKEQKIETSNVTPIYFLPFQLVGLQDMSDFKRATGNWKIVGRAYVDRTKDRTIIATEGTGVLINIPEENLKENLFTKLEHGDIELEVDVMMPKNSNSGLYFQSRYEIQLFDSWETVEPHYGDMGGIYQRWDNTKNKGKEGYEGHAPRTNAAKAPGLWQHFRIIFHAPKFDGKGEKIKNARFEKVWLNGVLIHENVELSGPTRSAANEEEKPLAPLMIQGDHGPVAIKNLQYKLYSEASVSFVDMKMKEYNLESLELPRLDSLEPIREVSTDSISAAMALGDKVTRVLDYKGKMVVPESGDYIFDFRLNQGGGLLIIDNDTLVNRDGNYLMDASGIGNVSLSKGEVPFRLIYNKHNPWVTGFTLDVEGPSLQKQPLHAPSSIDLNSRDANKKIMVNVFDEVVMQRSFLMHNGEKLTHCISVGTPQEINYAYNLANGSLLEVWSGGFLDATEMWHSRGQKQLGEPQGFTVSFHGNPEFAQLTSQDAVWPNYIAQGGAQKSEGYELDVKGIPSFLYKLNSSNIIDKMVASDKERSLKRQIIIKGDQEIWHKVAGGESIEKLPDGSYIVNNESYFIYFSDNSLNPIVRKSEGKEELLVKIPAGELKIEYSIIW